MKKLIASILAGVVIALPFNIFAETIYEYDDTTTITKGVTLQKLKTFTDSGWVKANIIRVDLKEDDVKLKVLTAPSGTSSLETVKKMADENGAKAAINADFFNVQSGETNMLGMVYKDGELVSTPSKDNFVSFVIDEDNRVLFDYFTFKGTLYAEDTSLTEFAQCELYQINKVPVTTGPISMLTSHWGETVFVPDFNYAMVCEPTEDENVYEMTSLSWGNENVPIPPGGAVFVVNYSVNNFLNEHFAIGDKIRVETEISPDTGKIMEASGGNTLLVKDGEVFEFTSNITGKAQRSAMGLSPSGKTLYLVTIDGREADCPGFTQTELAEFMISLGCDTAINLDGGGSTTMVAEDRFTLKTAVQNTLSSQRKVSTALGVISTARPSSAKGGEIKVSAESIVLGDKVIVSAAFYDRSYNTIPLENDDIRFYTDDRLAKIDGNEITFSKPGVHKVYAQYDGERLSTEVYVTEDIFKINIYPERVDTTSSSKAFTVTGYDTEGVKVNIPPSLVTFEATEGIEMEENVVRKGEEKGFVTAIYNSLSSNAVVNGERWEIPNEDIAAPDEFEGVIENGEKITIFGDMKEPLNLLGRFMLRERLSLLALKGDGYATGEVFDPDVILNFYRPVNGFTERVIENTKILTVSNTKGSSIRQTDSTAWSKIKTVCENIKEENLVIILNNPIYNLNKDEKEVWDYFMNMLCDNSVNVFVVSEGEKSEATVEDGVRYLYVGDFKTPSHASSDYYIRSSSPLTFYFLEDEIKYSFE